MSFTPKTILTSEGGFFAFLDISETALSLTFVTFLVSSLALSGGSVVVFAV